MKNIVLEFAYSYPGVTIERNVEVGQWDNGRETGTLFIGSGDSQKLAHIDWDDLAKMGIWTRGSDGIFRGCGNRAWYITEDEAAALIALDNERTAQIEANRPAREAAEAEYERHYQAVVKMMDDDIYPYC